MLRASGTPRAAACPTHVSRSEGRAFAGMQRTTSPFSWWSGAWTDPEQRHRWPAAVTVGGVKHVLCFIPPYIPSFPPRTCKDLRPSAWWCGMVAGGAGIGLAACRGACDLGVPLLPGRWPRPDTGSWPAARCLGWQQRVWGPWRQGMQSIGLQFGL